MPLLDNPPLTQAQIRANRVLALPRRSFSRLLRDWAAGLDLVWNPKAPTTEAQVLAALGTGAAELFQRSAALRAFLEAQKPGCTNIPAANRIKPVIVNPDGTVELAPASAR